MDMIKLTDLNGQDIYFPVGIAYRKVGNETQIRWGDSLYTVKESHEEVSQKLMDFQANRRHKTK